MAWVRIEDTAPEHRKHLLAGAAASWLWVCGIAYCQRQLTDGFIPEEALPMLGVPPREAKKLVSILVAVRLFDRADGGYQVHDYLDFNSTRDEAMAARMSQHLSKVQAGRAGGLARSRRLAGAKQPATADGKQGLADAGSRSQAPSHPIPSHPVVPSEQQQSGTPPTTLAEPVELSMTPTTQIPPQTRQDAPGTTNGRAPMPRVVGRVTLHHWQRQALLDALGPHAEQFNIDDWLLNDLSQRAGVIPLDRDARWTWLQQEFQARCHKLGLGGQAQTTGAFTEKWANFKRVLDAQKEQSHGH